MEILIFIIELCAWSAVVAIPAGYFIQIYKIHKHKEVRDLSQAAFMFYLYSYISLGMKAYLDGSEIFIAKNIFVAIPTIIILYQIKVHKNDTWKHDEEYESLRKKQDHVKVKHLHKKISEKKKKFKYTEIPQDVLLSNRHLSKEFIASLYLLDAFIKGDSVEKYGFKNIEEVTEWLSHYFLLKDNLFESEQIAKIEFDYLVNKYEVEIYNEMF